MKKQIGLFTAILFVVSTLMMACKAEVHTHTFSSKWTSDETNHWHAATCEHKDKVIDRAKHTFGDWTITKEPTEEAEGSREKSCSVCEYKVTEEIAKLEHTHKFATDWTKDETNHWHASTCGHEVTEGKTTHTFGDWITTKEPTEEAEGSKERTCTVCGYTATEVIEKLAHTHKFATDWTKDETNHWHASTCGHEVTEGKTSHTFGDWTVTKEATEEAEGTKERTCTVCGYKATEAIEKLAHTHKFATDWTSDETNHWHASTCGHTTEVSGKAAHSFGDWTITKEPTEEAEGSREKSCTVCEYTVPEVIAKLEHTHKFATDWTKDETNHWHASTCGHEVTEGKTTHTFGDWITTKEPTEEAEGSREKSCSVCKYIDTEVIEKLEHTHKFATDWTKDETNHWHASTCGHTTEVSGKAAHSFGEYVSNNDATTEADGTKTRECSVCGYKDTVTDEGSKIIVPEGFVFVKGATVTGAKNTNNYAGVFIEGRTVTLSDFYIGKYEVTQEEYFEIMNEKKVLIEGVETTLNPNPSRCRDDSKNYVLFNNEIQEKRPVEAITWYDALLYCNFLSEKENFEKCYNISIKKVNKYNNVISATVEFDENANGYRLPTEAEWEYAARGGNQKSTEWNYLFSGANCNIGRDFESPYNEGLDSVGWYLYNNIEGNTTESEQGYRSEGTGTHQVGLKNSNILGLYDMSGNVWEWCWDIFEEIYPSTVTNPLGAENGSYRMFKGGSWYDDASYACVCDRSSYYSPSFTADNLGFRVVRSAK